MIRFFVAMLALGLLLLFLSGCATTPEPKIVTKIVEVPVARACVPDNLPPRPAYADTREALKAAGAADQRYHLMNSEWMRRDARLNLLEGVVDACR